LSLHPEQQEAQQQTHERVRQFDELADQQLRERVRLLDELTELCLGGCDLDWLLQSFAKHLAAALKAVGVIVWELPPLGEPLVLAKQGFAPESCLESAHQLLVESVAARTQPITVLPQTVPTFGGAMTNATGFQLWLAPLPRVGGSTLILEVIQLPCERDAATQQGDRRFLMQVVVLLSDSLRRFSAPERPERLLIVKEGLLARWVVWLCRRLGMVDEEVSANAED
jgi:hypothetical protein